MLGKDLGHVICAHAGMWRSAGRITDFVYARMRRVSLHLPRHSKSGKKDRVEEDRRMSTRIQPNRWVYAHDARLKGWLVYTAWPYDSEDHHQSGTRCGIMSPRNLSA